MKDGAVIARPKDNLGTIMGNSTREVALDDFKFAAAHTPYSRDWVSTVRCCRATVSSTELTRR